MTANGHNVECTCWSCWRNDLGQVVCTWAVVLGMIVVMMFILAFIFYEVTK